MRRGSGRWRLWRWSRLSKAPVPYDRADYQGDGWSDVDADCMSTRHEVLVVESTADPVLSEDGCFVETGVWFDPWSDERITAAKEATIDHLIPLAHAHLVGASAWDADTKSRFTNDENPAGLHVAPRPPTVRKGCRPPTSGSLPWSLRGANTHRTGSAPNCVGSSP